MATTEILRTGRNLSLLIALAAMTAGCGGNRTAERAPEREVPSDNFGLRTLTSGLQTPPDAFSVMSRAPLEMPDRLDVLPPPMPGAPSRRDPDPIAEAQRALLPQAGSVPTAVPAVPSAAEAALLSSVGAPEPGIRETLAREQVEIEGSRPVYGYQQLFPSLRGTDNRYVLDAEAERERLAAERGTAAAVPALLPGATQVVPQPVPQTIAPSAIPAPAPVAAPRLGDAAPVYVSPAPVSSPQGTYEDSGLIYLPE